MARYPGAERERRIESDTLLRQVTAIFAACGMSDDDSAVLADSLVQADLCGIHSHGVLRVPDYVAKLTGEGVNPRGVPRVATRTGGAIVVDCDNSMGQIGGVFAMRRPSMPPAPSGLPPLPWAAAIPPAPWTTTSGWPSPRT